MHHGIRENGAIPISTDPENMNYYSAGAPAALQITDSQGTLQIDWETKLSWDIL